MVLGSNMVRIAMEYVVIFFQNFSANFSTCTRASKMRTHAKYLKNKNFGVQACVTHGWKGLEERNKLCKTTHALKLILEGLILVLKFFKSPFQSIPDSLIVVQFAS